MVQPLKCLQGTCAVGEEFVAFAVDHEERTAIGVNQLLRHLVVSNISNNKTNHDEFSIDTKKTPNQSKSNSIQSNPKQTTASISTTHGLNTNE